MEFIQEPGRQVALHANRGACIIKNFNGKVALITGGSSGIGLGLACALAAAGARLALIGTDAAKLDSAVATVAALGATVIGRRLDVADAAAWAPAVDEIERELGCIDLLVLNAGAINRFVPIEQTSLEEWRWIWSVNVDGVFHGLRTCLPRMKQRAREAHVLVTASIGGLMPRLNTGPYGASKAAVLALCEAVKLELDGSCVGISVLCPAGVRTSFNRTAQRNAPDAASDTYDFMKPIIDNGMNPLNVGEFVLKCVAEGRFYIFTHPGFRMLLEPRYAAMLAEFKDSAEPGSASFGA